MASLAGQETVVSQLRNGETYIYTANPVHLRALRKNPRAVEQSGGDDWGNFIVAAGLFDPLKGFKRPKRTLTPEQRETAIARLTRNR